jgi:hypothetical protein
VLYWVNSGDLTVEYYQPQMFGDPDPGGAGVARGTENGSTAPICSAEAIQGSRHALEVSGYPVQSEPAKP